MVLISDAFKFPLANGSRMITIYAAWYDIGILHRVVAVKSESSHDGPVT